MARDGTGLPEYTERQAVQSQTLGEPLLEKRPVVKGACRSCVGVISQKYINTFGDRAAFAAGHQVSPSMGEELLS